MESAMSRVDDCKHLFNLQKRDDDDYLDENEGYEKEARFFDPPGPAAKQGYGAEEESYGGGGHESGGYGGYSGGGDHGGHEGGGYDNGYKVFVQFHGHYHCLHRSIFR
jgi:hypothetical protein